MGALADSLAGSGLAKRTILFSSVLASADASIDLTAIPQITGADLHIKMSGIVTHVSPQDIYCYAGNGSVDTTASHYFSRIFIGHLTAYSGADYNSGGVSNARCARLENTSLDVPGIAKMSIPNYSGTVYNKMGMTEISYPSGVSYPIYAIGQIGWEWLDDSAIDVLQLIPASGSFEAGTSIKIWIEED